MIVLYSPPAYVYAIQVQSKLAEMQRDAELKRNPPKTAETTNRRNSRGLGYGPSLVTEAERKAAGVTTIKMTSTHVNSVSDSAAVPQSWPAGCVARSLGCPWLQLSGRRALHQAGPLDNADARGLTRRPAVLLAPDCYCSASLYRGR
eukprot:scaffold13298_cov35-Tisochrysis_lutea.AAC.3